MLNSVTTAVAQAMIRARPDALGASSANRLGCAISTSPTVSGRKTQRNWQIASDCTPTPYSPGVRKYAITSMAPAVNALFTSHCAELSSEPRKATRPKACGDDGAAGPGAAGEGSVMAGRC